MMCHMQMNGYTEAYNVYWYDAEKTILIGELNGEMTWEASHDFVRMGNALYEEVAHPIYSIIMVSETAAYPPKGGNVLAEIKRVIEISQGKEEILCLVGDIEMVRLFLRVSSAVHEFSEQTAHYQYAASVEDALQIIEQHKSQSA